MRRRQQQDSAWKDILDKYFPQFIQFFFPEIHRDIDFNKKIFKGKPYDFLDKEFQSIVKEGEIGRRYADKLIKVLLRDGSEKWLLIHIEIQGEEEKNFEERLYTYNYRIFDRYEKEVISLAILTDSSETFRPHIYERKRWGFRLSFEFPSVKLIDFRDREHELEESRNPFAMVVRAHLKLIESGKDDGKKYRWKRDLIKELHNKGFEKVDIQDLSTFIDWCILLPEDLEKKLKAEINEFEEGLDMPYVTSFERLGREEGREEAKSEVLKMLIAKKFGSIKEDDEKKLVKLNIAKLDTLIENIFDYQTYDDFKKLLDSLKKKRK